MKTFVLRLARLDGKQHLGELINIEIKSVHYETAAKEALSRYPEYYIVGYTER